MTSKYIILLIIFLFIIYCYRKPINRIIESFYSEDSSDDSTRNLLPPIASERVSGSSDFEINVPFRNAVGGTMTYDDDGSYLVQTNDSSKKCYTTGHKLRYDVIDMFSSPNGSDDLIIMYLLIRSKRKIIPTIK